MRCTPAGQPTSCSADVDVLCLHLPCAVSGALESDQGSNNDTPLTSPLSRHPTVSKGVEVSTGQLMSELIPSAIGKKHPCAYLSGPSFAKEVMDERPTGITVASKVGRGGASRR